MDQKTLRISPINSYHTTKVRKTKKSNSPNSDFNKKWWLHAASPNLWTFLGWLDFWCHFSGGLQGESICSLTSGWQGWPYKSSGKPMSLRFSSFSIMKKTPSQRPTFFSNVVWIGLGLGQQCSVRYFLQKGFRLRILPNYNISPT